MFDLRHNHFLDNSRSLHTNHRFETIRIIVERNQTIKAIFSLNQSGVVCLC